jgi:hypothetical protein
MKSPRRGKTTSRASLVESITPLGIWLFVRGEELFLDFALFPMLRDGTIASLLNVDLHGEDHLHWPDLDCDVELDSIRHPERYPLLDKISAARRKTQRVAVARSCRSR